MDESDPTDTDDRTDAAAPAPAPAPAPDDTASTIQNPLDLVRVGALLQTLVHEVREIDLDDAGRARLAQLHTEAVAIVRRSVTGDLEQELQELVPLLDLDRDPTPSDAEVRIAQAQLAGWLDGLFRGLQAMAVGRQAQALPGGGPPAPPALPGSTTGYL